MFTKLIKNITNAFISINFAFHHTDPYALSHHVLQLFYNHTQHTDILEVSKIYSCVF